MDLLSQPARHVSSAQLASRLAVITATAAAAFATLAFLPSHAQAAPIDPAERVMLQRINHFRTSHGLGRLRLDRRLTRVATWMGRDMGTGRRFGHVDSLGRDPFQRMARFSVTAGNSGWRGENLAAGFPGARQTLRQWRHSPSHRANLLRPQFRAIGIARVHVDGSPWGWYWVTEFGGRVNTPLR